MSETKHGDDEKKETQALAHFVKQFKMISNLKSGKIRPTVGGKTSYNARLFPNVQLKKEKRGGI